RFQEFYFTLLRQKSTTKMKGNSSKRDLSARISLYPCSTNFYDNIGNNLDIKQNTLITLSCAYLESPIILILYIVYTLSLSSRKIRPLF
ncbi:hypothetical protein, partial [Bartonella queenslandensis]|uniref:hypothetical protein n=1 Tax=Bartonella queenslandensis TaxID=481138 RepID=UPI001AEC3732